MNLITQNCHANERVMQLLVLVPALYTPINRIIMFVEKRRGSFSFSTGYTEKRSCSTDIHYYTL